jgi:hypothetical protein
MLVFYILAKKAQTDAKEHSIVRHHDKKFDKYPNIIKAP